MTKVISVDDPKVIHEAVNTLLSGGVILYPTETIYGLGVDATNSRAIQKIFSIKQRDFSNPMSIVLGSNLDIGKYSFETPLSKILAKKFLPGPLTLLLEGTGTLPNELTAGRKTIGIRIPDNRFCLSLAQEFGKPFTSTSANVSGLSPRATVSDILKELVGIDLAIDSGEISGQPSTVVDAQGITPRIMREGAISRDELTKI